MCKKCFSKKKAKNRRNKRMAAGDWEGSDEEDCGEVASKPKAKPRARVATDTTVNVAQSADQSAAVAATAMSSNGEAGSSSPAVGSADTLFSARGKTEAPSTHGSSSEPGVSNEPGESNEAGETREIEMVDSTSEESSDESEPGGTQPCGSLSRKKTRRVVLTPSCDGWQGTMSTTRPSSIGSRRKTT
jgi:hypothetical protein